MRAEASYERDTKRYHRFDITGPGIKGTIYLGKGSEVPKEIVLKIDSKKGANDEKT